MQYIDKHIDEVYTREAVPIDEYEEQPDDGFGGYRTKTIRSSDRVIECETFRIPSSKKDKEIKKIIRAYDPKARRRYHERVIEKNIFRIIVGNFTDNHMWLTLTYDNQYLPESENDAEHDAQLYIRRLQYESKKIGRTLKYVYVVAGSDDEADPRYHIHVVCDFHDKDLAESKWKKCMYPESEKLKVYPNVGLEAMARYVSCQNTGRKRKRRHIKGYGYSLGLFKSWLPRKDGGGMTKNDSVVSRKQAEKMGTGREDVKAFYEKMKKGYEVVFKDVRTSEHAPGWYIYVQMVRRE